MEQVDVHFLIPPLPYFIGCGIEHYRLGEKHISRYNVGCFDLVIVKQGEMFIGEGPNNWTVRKNEALILRPDLFHFGTKECKEDTIMFWVHFNSVGLWTECESHQEMKLSQLKGKYDLFGLPSDYIHSITIPKFFVVPPDAMGYIQEMIKLEKEPHSVSLWSQQSNFQQFLQLIDISNTAPQKFNERMLAADVLKFIRENYQKAISNHVLKREFNYHPNYIAKCVKNVIGLTPLEYLNTYRIEQSKNLLLNTNYSVGKIAEEVGMELSTYSNCFKDKVRMSPTEYRKRTQILELS